RFKLAGGLFAQNFISSRPDRDVVNLFNGFLSGPDATLRDFDGEVTPNNLQKAYHGIAGIEIDAGKHLEFNVETYYKRFYRLIEINRFKQFPNDPDFQIETGDAYGLDFLVKYDKNHFYF